MAAHSVRIGVVLTITSLLGGCATTAPPDEAVGQSTEAYTGPIATLHDAPAVPGAPRSWQQPGSEGVLGQNGYCGATAAANLLGWYDLNVSPRNAIDAGCWSAIGTTAYRIGAFLGESYPDLGCATGTLEYDADAKGALRRALAAGHPVLIEFMTGALDAHWVTVIGMRGDAADPLLVVMTWGGFKTIRWSEVQEAWRDAWGGYYPHVICRAVTSRRAAITVR